MSQHAPVGGKLLTKTFVICLALTLYAGYLLIDRFTLGLGSITNINDGYPWGIWVALDVVIGTALGCGGFAVAFLLYILNKWDYHPLMRPALLASVFGYSLGGLAVFIDLGRYWQIYNVFVPGFGQINSVMFEVALCVAAYVIVLWVEFLPVFFEKFGMTDAQTKLNKFLFFFIGLGVLLPVMHQSSLGTMLVVLGHQLSPIWQTNLLPLLFLASAISMGYAIVVFESLMASSAMRRPLETEILSRLSGVMVWTVGVFVVVRFGDLIARDALGLAFAGGLNTVMFIIETALFVIPLALLIPAAGRSNPRTLFVAAALLLAAGSIYRINTYLVGYQPAAGWSYFPSVSEIMVTIGLFAFEVVLYLIFVKKLPVLVSHKSA